MKQFLILTILLSSICYAQDNTSSLLQLKQEMQVTLEQNSDSFDLMTAPQKKKPGVAMLYSLLLPGMGELYADGYDSGIYFTAADIAIWGTLIGMNLYGNWQQENYKTFAETNAGISNEGKSGTFYGDIANYNSVEDFNTEKLLSREFTDVYNTSSHYWNWSSNEVRREYREMWSSSEQAFNNLRFVFGALLLNRVISMINAVRLVNKYNRELESLPDVSLNVQYGPDRNPYLTLNLKQMF